MNISHDLLVRAGTLVTQDAQRSVLCDAGVAVSDGVVRAVGPWSEVGALPAREVLDHSGDIVLPGLVNAHTHAAMTVFRGMEDDMPLLEWLMGHIWPAEARLTPEIVALGTTLAAAEMLAGGTTCFCDLYLFERRVAETAHAVGIRGVCGEGIFDTPNASYSGIEAALERVEELEDFCRGKDLVRPCLVAHSVYATGAQTLARLRDMARERGRLLTLHAAESPAETAMCLERFGKRPVAILEDLDMLGPELLVAHAVDVTEREIALMAAKGVSVAHNPRSNMKLASGMAPIARMLAEGVRVGLGTDGAASNNALNMFQEMGAAALMAKAREADPTALPAQAVLDMATLGGAGAVGWPELGRIAPGSPADLVALDGRAPHRQPPRRGVTHRAYAARGGAVRMTRVGGRVRSADGRVLSLDSPGLLHVMAAVRKWARGA